MGSRSRKFPPDSAAHARQAWALNQSLTTRALEQSWGFERGATRTAAAQMAAPANFVRRAVQAGLQQVQAANKSSVVSLRYSNGGNARHYMALDCFVLRAYVLH
ncbi:hypothetical protein P3T76_002523 [Phytophthora citrophthora]|uniref:Uncharacterized protein n=1 Tax=Phytophthora citrophthora TaxID=4793 RepID=A0AAD9GV58_9STRA|nr:hypothetical protein P3T76_002523 [Phytophthora citrophthora]